MRNESVSGSELYLRRGSRACLDARRPHLLVVLGLAALLLPAIVGCASTAPGRKYMARYDAASKYYREKKYEATLEELKPVLIHFPVWIDGALLYASAARGTETIEGRRQASQILARLVSNYPERRDIRHELASLYFDQGFFGYSKSQYETLLKSDYGDSQSHYMLGLIMQKDWKRYRHQKDLSRMIAEFAGSAQTDTLNREALSHLALAYFERDRPDSMQLVINRLRGSFPSDPDAIMLSAIAHHERGEFGASLDDWKQYFSLCDSSTRKAFEDISLLLTPQQRTRLKHLTRAAKEQFVRTFWKELDPTPTTELNERVLEHWRRVGLSKALFTITATRTPGWLTGPGEALIRYGFPKSREYASASSGAGGSFLPTLTWYYYDENGPFAVTFVDYALSGEFQYFEFPETPLPTAFDARAYHNPSYYDHNYHAQVFENSFASAAFLGDSGVREEIYLGIPLERVTKGDWRRVPFEAVVFDSLWTELARVSTNLDGARTYAERGTAALLIRELDFKLLPGKYTVAVAVNDSTSGTLGLTKEKITVPSFSSQNLGVSDIELAYLLPEKRVEAGTGRDGDLLPNPSGTYVSPSPLRLYYEVYHLAQARDGRYRFTTRYSILPSGRRSGSLWGYLASLLGPGEHYIVSSFDRQVEHSSSAERLSIDISALKAGSYNLVLEVEDSVSGHRVTAERAFDKLSPPVSDASAGESNPPGTR